MRPERREPRGSRASQYPRFSRHQLFELGCLPELFELGLLHQLFTLLEPFFKRHADVLDGALGVARLGVGFREVVMEARPFGHGALLQQSAISAAMLEDFGVERKSLLIGLESLFVFLAREL